MLDSEGHVARRAERNGGRHVTYIWATYLGYIWAIFGLYLGDIPAMITRAGRHSARRVAYICSAFMLTLYLRCIRYIYAAFRLCLDEAALYLRCI